MATERFDIIANDGLKISGYSWLPASDTIGVICIAHGVGEHARRYTGLANYFNDKGFAVYSYDQRGHGESEGKRGHASSFALLLEDLENILKTARSEYPDLPLFLYGHSWGGNIALNYVLKRKLKEIHGLILSSPWLEQIIKVSPVLLKLSKTLSAVFPSLITNNRITPAMLSKDPEAIKDFVNDPLTHHKISLATFFQSCRSGTWALENASKLATPTLIMHGTKDEVTSWARSKEFAEKAGVIVDFKSWEDVKHEPHNDWEKQEVYEFLLNWIIKNMPLAIPGKY